MNVDLKDIRLAPNIISTFRLLLSFPICFIFLNYKNLVSSNYLIVLLILLAFLSDLLDGFIARKFNHVSELGKVIDPFADKFLTAIIVFFMWYYDYFSTLFLVVIMLRDILIFVSGVFVSRKIGYVIASDYIGKTTVFSIGIYILYKLITETLSGIVNDILFWIVIVLSILSLINYFFRGIKLLRTHGNI